MPDQDAPQSPAMSGDFPERSGKALKEYNAAIAELSSTVDTVLKGFRPARNHVKIPRESAAALIYAKGRFNNAVRGINLIWQEANKLKEGDSHAGSSDNIASNQGSVTQVGNVQGDGSSESGQ